MNGTFKIKLKFEDQSIVDQEVSSLKGLKNIFKDVEAKFK